MQTFTFGTHNLHDQAAHATPFADIILFTEAPKGRTGARALRAKLPGYVIAQCRRQSSLVIAYRKTGPFKPRRLKPSRFIRAHGGRKRVTPMRGTWCLIGTLHDEPAAVGVEHRINRSYRAARGSFRRKKWREHKRKSGRFVRHQEKRGRLALIGGDTNCAPRGSHKFAHLAYAGVPVNERGRHLDRLGIDKQLRAGKAVYLSKAGSDHPRLYVEVSQP